MNESKRTELSEPSIENINTSQVSPLPSPDLPEEEKKPIENLDIPSAPTTQSHNVSEAMSSPEPMAEYLTPLPNPIIPIEGPSGQSKDKSKKEKDETNGHSKPHKDKKKKNKKEKKKHKHKEHKSKHKHKDKDRHHSDRRSHDRTSSGGSTNASPIKH